MRAAAVGLLICAGVFHGEIIDRIAISVANQVITEGQVDEEIRLTAFLNGSKLDLSAAERKKASDRMIEQALVKRDIQFSHYPPPTEAEAAASWKALRDRYVTEMQYQQALREYGITEDGLKARLIWQLTVLEFVDYRFRPGIQITDQELQEYYQKELDKWKQKGVAQIPSFEDSRIEIEQILTEQHVDQALDRWIAETRTQVPIVYLDETLR